MIDPLNYNLFSLKFIVGVTHEGWHPTKLCYTCRY